MGVLRRLHLDNAAESIIDPPLCVATLLVVQNTYTKHMVTIVCDVLSLIHVCPANLPPPTRNQSFLARLFATLLYNTKESTTSHQTALFEALGNTLALAKAYATQAFWKR